MRSRIALLFGLAGVLAAYPAQADMIEIKDRGVMNGKILSQDDNEVRFEDSAKNVFVVPKSDVLFLEAQTDVAASIVQKKGQVMAWKPDMKGWRRKAEHYYKAAKRFALDKTQGIRDFIMAPLDRSAADDKSKKLADSMGDLSKNLKSLNKQDRKRSVQMQGMKADREALKNKGKSKSTQLSGGFASLD